MSDVQTWHERAMRHPDHQSGMISEGMIRARMCEEIADLRAEVEKLTRELNRARTEVERLRAFQAALDGAISCVPSQIADGLLAGEFTRDSAFVPLAEIERLRAVLKKFSCDCAATRECVAQWDEDGECPHLLARKALEAKP